MTEVNKINPFYINPFGQQPASIKPVKFSPKENTQKGITFKGKEINNPLFYSNLGKGLTNTRPNQYDGIYKGKQNILNTICIA